jgi:hypothetical protein
MVILGLFTISAAGAASGQNVGLYPATYNGKMIWSDVAGDIYIGNVGGSDTVRIDCVKASHPDIGDRYATWLEEDGTPKIAVCDLETMEVSYVLSRDVTASSRPLISGGKIVWSANNYVFVSDIASGSVESFAYGNRPAVCGNRIVYGYYGGTSTVAVYDIETHTTFAVLKGYELKNPRISGDWVVATDQHSGTGGLVLWNFISGEVRKITATEVDIEKSDCVPDTGFAYDIYGERVVYAKTTNCDGTAGLYVYDISSDKHLLLSPTESESIAPVPAIFDKTVVWGYADTAGLEDVDMPIYVCADLTAIAAEGDGAAATEPGPEKIVTGRLTVKTNQDGAVFYINSGNERVAQGKGREWNIDLPVGDYTIYFGGVEKYYCHEQTFTLTAKGKTVTGKYEKLIGDTLGGWNFKRDYGYVVIPQEEFPEGEGKPIRIYVPPLIDGKNELREEEGWRTVKEIKKSAADFDPWTFATYTITGMEGDGGEEGAPYMAFASAVKSADMAYCVYGANIVVQANDAGDMRATVFFVDDSIGWIFKESAGGYFWDEAHTIQVDKSHGDDEYMAYLSLSEDGKIMCTPIVYPGDYYTYKASDGWRRVHDLEYLEAMKCAINPVKVSIINKMLSPCQLVLQG